MTDNADKIGATRLEGQIEGLAQNKEQFHGYSVFHIYFNDVLVKMMAFEDVKKIVSDEG